MKKTKFGYVEKVLQKQVGVSPKLIEPFKESWVVEKQTTNGIPEHQQLLKYDSRILYYGKLTLKMFVDSDGFNNESLKTADELPYIDKTVGEAVPVITGGRLYNGIAHRNMIPAGCCIPTQGELNSCATYYGTATVGTRLKKSTGWGANVDGLNDLGFNGVGSGKRSALGLFTAYGEYHELRCGLPNTTMNLRHNAATWALGSPVDNELCGSSVRFRKITTALLAGQTGTIIGNDGKIYPTICITNGSAKYEIMSVDSMETMFTDKTHITNAKEAAHWQSLSPSMGCWCDYDNNANNSSNYVNSPLVAFDDFDLVFDNGSWAVLNTENFKKQFGNRLARKVVQALNEIETSLNYHIMSAMRLTYCVNASGNL